MLARSSIVLWKTGRAGVGTPNAPLTKVAWLRGNDGCNRKYRVRPLGATRPSLFGFRPSLHSSTRRASPTVVPPHRFSTAARECASTRLINLRTCGHFAAERTFGHGESTSV